jgi:hypothetical protein
MDQRGRPKYFRRSIYLLHWSYTHSRISETGVKGIAILTRTSSGQSVAGSAMFASDKYTDTICTTGSYERAQEQFQAFNQGSSNNADSQLRSTC